MVHPRRTRRRVGLLLLVPLFAVLSTTACTNASPERPTRNIILFIGDGMGSEQVKAGSLFAYGTPGHLSFEAFPSTGEVTTFSADNEITDSAAAATAMATGHKVNNGVISMALPGDGRDLETLVEHYAARGKRTGLVTTTTLTHATPAAFAAHAANRSETDKIADDLINQTHVDLLLGGGGSGMTTELAQSAGYTVAHDRTELAALGWVDLPVSGLFGEGYLPYELDGLGALPHLSEMTSMAIDLLQPASSGFFLMIEGGRIDHAGHANDIERLVREVSELSRAVALASEWASDRVDTLIVVTADHETGGLEVIRSLGEGTAPVVTWQTTGHTSTSVPLYASGSGAHRFAGSHDNTSLHELLAEN